MPLHSGQLLGPYRIVSLLGSGGLGRVYLADDTRLRRKIALKVLEGNQARGALHEARAAAALNHPNIADIYDIGRSGEVAFIAMEYVEGQTLRARMQAGPLEPAEASRIILAIARALSSAHSRGVVHRDVKPENVMIDKSGEVKVLDFGLASFHPHDAGTPATLEYTTRQGIAGTPRYMSPEQAMAKRIDTRSDIFSLGVVFYEMLSGRAPFRGQTTVDILHAVIHDSPQPLGLGREFSSFERIVDKCLKKDPDLRYGSMAELMQDIESHGKRADPVSLRPAPIPQPARGLRSFIVVLACLVLGLLGWLAYPWLPGQGPLGGNKNVVMLPLRIVGNEQPDQHYWDGVVETVTTSIGASSLEHGFAIVPTVEVRSRNVRTPEEARIELGAGYVVAGTLEESAGTVRINLSMIDTSTRRQVGANTITLGNKNPFTVQDHVVRGVAQILRLPLAPGRSELASIPVAQTPGSYDFYLRGRGYLQNYDRPENLDRAIDLFQESSQLDPGFALAYAGLGETFLKKYEITRDATWLNLARSNCERALALDNGFAAPHNCRGAVENSAGRYEEAAREFQQAVDLEPANETARIGLATAYDELGRFAEAERIYLEAIRLRPNYWAVYSRLGAYYVSRKRYDEAEKMFRQVVALAPDSYRAFSNLGAVYLYQRRSDLALSHFEKSLSLKPNYVAASNLGTLRYFSGDVEGAILAFEQALKIDPGDYTVWMNLGEAYQRAGKAVPAQEAFSKAADLAEQRSQLNPRDAKVLVDLGSIYSSLGDRSKAASLLSRALRLAPDDTAVLLIAAMAYTGLGQREEAFNRLAHAIGEGLPLSDIQKSVALAPLRTDPRYKALEKKAAASAGR